MKRTKVREAPKKDSWNQALSRVSDWSFCCCSCCCLAVKLFFCDPIDCNLPGSSVHGIFQARILEWLAISFSRGSSRPRDQTQVSCIAVRLFTDWGTIPFCRSVMSNSFWPHGLQHTRLPCPSLTPGAYSNSCLISWWPHEQFEKELQGKPNKTLSLLPNEILFSPVGWN